MQHPGEKVEKTQTTKSMRQSNVMLGNDYQVNVSENQEHYDFKTKQDYYKIDQANKKSHSHRFGEDTNQFSSMNNRFHGAKDI